MNKDIDRINATVKGQVERGHRRKFPVEFERETHAAKVRKDALVRSLKADMDFQSFKADNATKGAANIREDIEGFLR